MRRARGLLVTGLKGFTRLQKLGPRALVRATPSLRFVTVTRQVTYEVQTPDFDDRSREFMIMIEVENQSSIIKVHDFDTTSSTITNTC